MPQEKSKQVVLHPLLFAAFPPLFLLTTNANFIAFNDVVGPLLFCLATGCVVWFVLHKVIGDIRRAAMVASLLLFICFSFGPLLDVFTAFSSVEAERSWRLGSSILVIDILLITLAAAIYTKMGRFLHEVTYLLNIVGMTLLAFPIVGSTTVAIRRLEAKKLIPNAAALQEPIARSATDSTGPDIYYIVLDGYGRADFLKDEFDFDNSKLIEFLTERNFFVARDSRSNYPQTLLSLGSSLNLCYLQDSFGDKLAEVRDRKFLREFVEGNRATEFLRSAGYSIVSVAGLFSDADIGDADVRIGKWSMLNSVESNLFLMTPIPWIYQQSGRPLLYDMHRKNLLNSFAGLAESARLPGPKFVFSYIFAAHPPFVFGRNGEPINQAGRYRWDDGDKLTDGRSEDQEEYIRRYRDQVEYLNEKLMGAVDAILRESPSPPVIIIQGDHGPGTRFSTTQLANTDIRERYSILNAYLMPDGGEEVLYESISPVNSFRAVFNRYLKTSLPLLEDCSYYTPWLEPYNFTSVSCDSGQFTASAPGDAREIP